MGKSNKTRPNDWVNYKPYGSAITGTKIVPFKVPLRDSEAYNLHLDDRLTPTIMMEAFPKMKYVIDLTNTDKYYDPSEFINAGIEYQKIYIAGMRIPPFAQVKEFFKAIEKFTNECGPDEVIGVVCTYGIHRSGYLIIRYLIQQLGQTYADAYKNFADARGHPIERDYYIADLQRQPVGGRIDLN